MLGGKKIIKEKKPNVATIQTDPVVFVLVFFLNMYKNKIPAGVSCFMCSHALIDTSMVVLVKICFFYVGDNVDERGILSF